MSLPTDIATGSVRSGSPVLYATLGELISERAGVINLGTEGCMAAGACAGIIATAETGNAFVGVAAGMLAGALLALIHAYMVLARGANQLASGLALMFLGLGLAAFFGRPYVSENIEGLDRVAIPGLSQLPFVGRALFEHDLLTYAVFPLAALTWWVVFRTRWGIYLRAVGEHPEAAFAAGIHPARVQAIAVAIGGAFAGIGGAQLSLAIAQSWVAGMTGGRGFIAVALVIFAMWNPWRAIAGALLFGGALATQLQLQARGVAISPFLLEMTPYLVTLVVLLLWNRASRHAMPQGLQAVFRGTG